MVEFHHEAGAPAPAPGPLVLFGSGETAPNVQRVYTWLFQQIAQTPVSVAVLETPAGFEPNSPQVAGQAASYLERHLVNFAPQVTVVPARARGTAHSPDDAATIAPLWDADVLMAGPGSPSYAVRQLRGSLAWEVMRARHRLGAGLVFSSAMTLAIGRRTLPVYEIYKVGEELHWKRGLNLLDDYGLSLVLVSHWNNSDGGHALDTSRCYMGGARFTRLRAMLPREQTILGIDEKTALCIDFGRASCRVLGAGGVIVLREGSESRFEPKQEFPLGELGDYRPPDQGAGIAPAVWGEALERSRKPETPQMDLPPAVVALAQEREAARARRDWEESDRLREEIAALGWRIQDTPTGPEISPQP